jgi:DNA-binding winged helix-turn-helix (wHTH) protein
MLNPTTAAATHFPAIRTFPLMAAGFTSTAPGGSERKNRPRSCYFFRNCDGAAPIGRNHRFVNVRGACPQPQSFLVHLCFTVQVKAKWELSGLEHPLDPPSGQALHSLHREEIPIHPAAGHQTIRFGTFEADLRAGDLRKNGLRVKIQEKPFQILGLLLERAGEAVTREELREKLWSADTFVDFDHSLGTAIGKLRQALGDSAKRPLFIETLGSRGYRFIAPVASSGASPTLSIEKPAVKTARRKMWLIVVAATDSMLAAAAIAPRAGAWRNWLLDRPPVINSLAVLPLEDLARDPDQEYFADGMTDELITDLVPENLPALQFCANFQPWRSHSAPDYQSDGPRTRRTFWTQIGNQSP